MRIPLSLLAICLFTTAISAQTPSPSPQSSPQITLKEYRDILDNERKLLDDQSEKYYGRIDSLMNRTTWAMGFVGAFALGVIVWLVGKTRKDLEEFVHQQVKQQAASLIESDMASLKSSVESDVSTLRSSMQEVEAQVERLRAFQNQLVVWVFAGTEMNAQPELDALRGVGLDNISILTPAQDEAFEIGEPDLVILSFDGTDEGRRRLSIIVAALNQKSPPVSLLIYTFNPDGEVRLQAPDWEILRDFRWYLPVNFPTTLLSQSQLLIRPKQPTQR